MHIFYICVCVYIGRLLTALSCNPFVDFSRSSKHRSAWEESHIWQLPIPPAFPISDWLHARGGTRGVNNDLNMQKATSQ